MGNFKQLSLWVIAISLMPFFHVLGEDQTSKIPGSSIDAVSRSTELYRLEGKLLKVEGEFWILEDLFGNQHRIQIGEETKLPTSPKQPRDSIYAVVTKNNHAESIQ